jgi:predicted nucleic acid-binding Zn ribbon protein
MIKNCVICNSEFNSIKTTKTCSTKCADTLAKQTYNKKYQRYLEKSKELGMSVSEYKAYIKVNRNKDTCIICGKSFNRHGTTKTCSIECRLKNNPYICNIK